MSQNMDIEEIDIKQVAKDFIIGFNDFYDDYSNKENVKEAVTDKDINNNIVFTFENGTWVLIRPRNTVQTFTNVVENMTSATGRSTSFHISFIVNNVRLFFNIITAGLNSKNKLLILYFAGF